MWSHGTYVKTTTTYLDTPGISYCVRSRYCALSWHKRFDKSEGSRRNGDMLRFVRMAAAQRRQWALSILQTRYSCCPKPQ